MKIITYMLAAMLACSAAVAQTPAYSHLPPGGASSASLQFLADGLNSRGYNVDSKALNNCSLVKSTWDSTTGPMIALRDDLINNDILPQCEIKTTKDNLVLYANSSPLYFCNIGDNKTLEDFLRPGTSWVVGTNSNQPDFAFFDKVSKEAGNKIKVLQLELVPAAITAAKSKEIDFIMANGSWPETALGAKCFFVTGTQKITGYKNATELWPNNEISRITYGYWFIAKGYTAEQMEKLRKDAKEIWQGKEWTELRKKRAWNDDHVSMSMDEAVKVLEDHRSIWTKYRR